MNIYDEAIEKLKSVMAKFIIPSVEDSDYGCLYDRCHFYNSLDEEEDKWLRNVYKALERAKKEHELLDFMREREFLTNLSGVLMGELQPINIDERMSYLGTIIDKLEEELK